MHFAKTLNFVENKPAFLEKATRVEIILVYVQNFFHINLMMNFESQTSEMFIRNAFRFENKHIRINKSSETRRHLKIGPVKY